MVILNTCHIREKASEKVFSELGRLRAFKEDRQDGGGDMVLAVAGCVAQAEGEEILRRAPQVDWCSARRPITAAGTGRPRRAAPGQGSSQACWTSTFRWNRSSTICRRRRRIPAAAALSVQEGCDKFCAFCVVPYTRGAEVLAAGRCGAGRGRAAWPRAGCEITLLGQNVNAYHGEGRR